MALRRQSGLVLALVIVVAAGIEAGRVSEKLELILGTGDTNYKSHPKDDNCNSVSYHTSLSENDLKSMLIILSTTAQLGNGQLVALGELLLRCQHCCEQHNHKPPYHLQKVARSIRPYLQCSCKYEAIDGARKPGSYKVPFDLS